MKCELIVKLGGQLPANLAIEGIPMIFGGPVNRIQTQRYEMTRVSLWTQKPEA